MAGIYLHIPFCKKACHYCNFHFSTSQKLRQSMLESMLTELEIQKDYLQDARVGSIYFGGGTPSILSPAEITAILEKIYTLHSVEADAEITLEGNPDDLTWEYLHFLKTNTPINRLSIGIQSFFEEDLQWMNRAHSSSEAKKCLENAQKVGFQQLTADLIYGSPSTSNAHWQQNLEQLFAFDLVHFSAYCLTVEAGTALDSFVKKGKQPPVDEARATRQFEFLMKAAAEAGYEHYEISNFAKPNHRAKHNSNYWLGEKYLGIGPSAHSFNGFSRQWNVANNALYIKGLEKNILHFEDEILSPENRYNEYVMTSLRTAWGTDFGKISAHYPNFSIHFLEKIETAIQNGTVIKIGEVYYLSPSGKLLADRIAADLFV